MRKPFLNGAVKKIKRIRKTRPGLFLVAGCYLCGFIVLFCVQLGGFAQNRVRYALGQLAQARLTVSDFVLRDIESDGDVLRSTGADPRLMLKDASRLVENLTVEMEYARRPRSRTVFWTEPGREYSLRRMAYSYLGQGRVFYLPAAGVRGLRIDPDTVPGAVITVKSIVINTPRPLWAFFAPGTVRLALLLTVPGLAACAVSIVRQAGLLRIWRAIRRKAGGAV